MPDPKFADRRLAATYDVFEAERDDLDAYERMLVDEFRARSVLDVGCGTGVLAIRLARRGLTVLAVDPAEASVELAKGKDGADAVTWHVGDATTLPAANVDAAVMTANVAQVFVTDGEWSATLDAISQVLRPGGHLVFETREPGAKAWEEWTPERTRERATLPTGETVETWCELLTVADGLVSFRWTSVFGSDGVTLTSDSTLRFRTRDEVERSLVAAGYELLDVRDAPDRPGRELVFVARRP